MGKFYAIFEYVFSLCAFRLYKKKKHLEAVNRGLLMRNFLR